MDSLTQITLGAAVGELVLGHKVGNRAMLWGAIAGTLPDMDVLANFAGDDISSLAYHRAITHSLFFAVAMPPALGWLVHRLYDYPDNVSSRGLGRDILRISVFLFLLLFLGAKVLPIPWDQSASIALTVLVGMLFFPLTVFLRERLRRQPSENGNTQWRDWMWLLFWAIVTHPLLDCCTAYGTQFFQPFSNIRIAWNNVSVVDPAYTLPFLLCVIIAARFTRGGAWRRRINTTGLVLSTLYLLWGGYNKIQVDRIFAHSLQEQGITYSRFTTGPTMFNNLLWQGVAEGDSALYLGSYSLLDPEPRVLQFQAVTKNHELIDPYPDNRAIGVLRWFSNNYFSVHRGDDGLLRWADWRYGGIPGAEDQTSPVFQFILAEDEAGVLTLSEARDDPPDMEGVFPRFWHRLKGNP